MNALFERGAYVNAPATCWDTKDVLRAARTQNFVTSDVYYRSPLCFAAFGKHLQLVEGLVRKGTDAN